MKHKQGETVISLLSKFHPQLSKLSPKISNGKYPLRWIKSYCMNLNDFVEFKLKYYIACNGSI